VIQQALNALLKFKRETLNVKLDIIWIVEHVPFVLQQIIVEEELLQENVLLELSVMLIHQAQSQLQALSIDNVQ